MTEKICRMPDGRLAALSGDLGDSAAFLYWCRGGAKGDPPMFQDNDSEGLIIAPDGTAVWVGGQRTIIPLLQAPFYAIGSGFRLAIGAMAAGATALRAVEIAADLDCYTRRPIAWLKHEEVS